VTVLEVVRVRSRFAAWLESILPWYDQDRERAKFARFQQQIVESQKIRHAANHVIADSRRQRRGNMRSSFRAAGDRLGGR
jgi:RecB family exonuclease